MAVVIIRDTGAENVAKTVRWRFTDNEGTAYTQADITSLKYDAYDLQDTDTALADDTALVVSTTIYDTLQTGEGWDYDTTGWNAKATFSGTLFATEGSVIRIEVFAVLAADASQVLAAIIEVNVVRIIGG